MTRYKRVSRDLYHKDVMNAFKSAGCMVTDTAPLGNGFPDLVVVRPDGTVLLVEVKTDENIRAGKIEREVEFMISHVTKSYRIVSRPDQVVAMVQEVE